MREMLFLNRLFVFFLCHALISCFIFYFFSGFCLFFSFSGRED